jgi:hypothetical protein
LTARSAERITGLEIRQVPYGGGKSSKAYGLYLPDCSVELFSTHGTNPSLALARLVELNYQRVKSEVFDEQRWRCFHCYRLGLELQCDHVKPRSKGRDDGRLNLRGVDPECHARITAGENLDPHPRMVELMSKIGLRWLGSWDGPITPCGWERI